MVAFVVTIFCTIQQHKDVRLLMNDSQNNQYMQNDQVDIMPARDVDALAIKLVDPAAPTVISKVKLDNVQVVFYNKEPTADELSSYIHNYLIDIRDRLSKSAQALKKAEHFHNNRVEFTQTKGKKTRNVPIPEELYRKVREHFASHGGFSPSIGN